MVMEELRRLWKRLERKGYEEEEVRRLWKRLGKTD